MNKKTVSLTEEQYRAVIQTINNGFSLDGVQYRPNPRIATALTLEANLGLRIGDLLSLTLSHFIADGERYRLELIEAKTGKVRRFTVPFELYRFIKLYALERGIKTTATLFPITERCVQKHLQRVCRYLNLQNIGTHSFRKYFSTQIYMNNNYNIRLVNELLQHASITTTQRYIGIGSAELENALKNHIKIFI